MKALILGLISIIALTGCITEKYVVEETDGSKFGDSYTAMHNDYVNNTTDFRAIFKYTYFGGVEVSREYFKGYLDELSNFDPVGSTLLEHSAEVEK